MLKKKVHFLRVHTNDLCNKYKTQLTSWVSECTLTSYAINLQAGFLNLCSLSESHAMPVLISPTDSEEAPLYVSVNESENKHFCDENIKQEIME